MLLSSPLWVFICRRSWPLLPAVLALFVGAPALAVERVFEIAAEDSVIGESEIVEEITLANPAVDPWVPGDGVDVQLPTRFVLPVARRSGLVINIAEYRLYFFYRRDGKEVVETYPISIGRMDWSTPLGRSSVTNKVYKPTWYPPASVREEYAADGRTLASQVPPGPDNPLGDYALRLSIPGYLIHGTNRPAGVGMRVTHGCIRMFPEDIELLFPRVAINTPVQIVNQPFKMGWLGDELYLEVHRPLDEDAGNGSDSLTAITQLYVQATRTRAASIDWQKVDEAYREKRGIPLLVGLAVQEEPISDDVVASSRAVN